MAESRPNYGPTLKKRDTASGTELETQSTPIVEATLDVIPPRKSGPRSIGIGKSFSVVAADLPPTVYDRTPRNPFSPIAVDDLWDLDLSSKKTLFKRSLPEFDVKLDTSDNQVVGEVKLSPTPHRVLTVPWLPAPARRDGIASRRSLTGWDNPSMEIANKGSLPNRPELVPSIMHTPTASPTPNSSETNAGLGASIALSVILGLAAIGLTTWAGLSYRRKKKLASNRRSKRARDDDEESFTCSGPEEGEEVDTEKGLKSPSPSPEVSEDTPKPKKGFRLWSPLPLFSPNSPSRSGATTSPSPAMPAPAPMRRAVLDSPNRGSGHGLTISTSTTSIASTKSQSLLDALDSPIPLALSPIAEETMSMRSHSSIDELHRRLSIASVASSADSMRRNSATSTYSSCSDRSSSSTASDASSSSDREVSASDEEIESPERSFSFSSETPSVLIETPIRVDTPTSIARPAETTDGLPLPTAPSAASIHEALDDMIGLFCQPPDVDHTRALAHSAGEAEPPKSPVTPIPHLAEVAVAIGKVAFAKDHSSRQHSATVRTLIPDSLAPMEEAIIRPANPLFKTAAFAGRPSKPFIAALIDHPFTPTARPCTPVRRHSLPIALLSRRVEKSTPGSVPKYSELYGKDHLRRGLLGLRGRQNSLPTVTESEALAHSDFVQAAHQFTANLDRERARLETRRQALFSHTSDSDIRIVETTRDHTPEREALARFLASVSKAEDSEESQESFSPHSGEEWDEDQGCSRWLVYEENFPLPESGLPQIMVTCH